MSGGILSGRDYVRGDFVRLPPALRRWSSIARFGAPPVIVYVTSPCELPRVCVRVCEIFLFLSKFSLRWSCTAFIWREIFRIL